MDTTVSYNDIVGIKDESAEQLHASCSFLDEIFGDPQVIPRVGDQYQAEIPPLVGECCSLQVVKEPIDTKVVTSVPNPFPMGLPIPLIWTKTKVESINGAVDFENSGESHITLSHWCAEYKVESLGSVSGNGNDTREYLKHKPTTKTKMVVDLLSPMEPKSKPNQVDGDLYPLPGSSSEVWKDIELNSFLLGLYIFGKNLILVKIFVESKGMGEILSFYYGKFYKSDGYCRWSDCRKLRGRRCVHGQKLFTGWRQQELLSRLSSHVSEECRDMLLEVSKTFGEGKVSFKEYVFTIKNTVGITMLVEAVGIGKGKQDLTGNAMEPIKANHVVSFRPEIPVGKACSTLTSVDIINFLTGDFRLSKARCSDLFWEAVWPRLLARGWHSEQPKDQVFSGSKNSLVFLMPGVKKFSRRLVKGNHYFDSVSDVLNKVASEPGLLELEIELPKDGREENENKWEPAIKQDPGFISNKHGRYLKPRNPGCNRDLMKFTIVDTSLVRGTERSKVRELRSLLPEVAANLSTPSSLYSDSGEDTSDDSENVSEENSVSHAAEAMADEGECAEISDCVNSNSNIAIPLTSDMSIVSVKNHESHHASLLDDDWKMVTKEQGLTDYANGESSCSVENVSANRMLNEDNLHYRSNSPDDSENMVFQTGSVNLSPAGSLSKGSPDDRKEGIVAENHLHREESPTKSQLHTLIDLNVGQVSMDFETEGPFVTETTQNSENLFAHTSFNQSEVTMQPDKVAEVNQQPVVHNRRQSTRNRPLTTKALEALECGFFSPKRKRTAAETPEINSQRIRSRPVVNTTFRKRKAVETPQNSSESVRSRPVVSAIFRNGAVGKE
ncbi:hypothetical protein Golob_012554 [Gossypium lobatum]|uniref:SANT domain-containing protein n=1 Tax=Gossypium lobatum TaxID=34289 RepID=A0A7J8LLQ1_9ROSI|nr:hypothetical protein [Gossypium lobatum]